MRLIGIRPIKVPGWTAGVREQTEPGSWDPTEGGVLDDAANMVPVAGGRIAVRGGSAPHLRFQAGAISQVLGVWTFSPTGAVAIAYSATAQKHYAYALTAGLKFALPNNNATELGSRVELGAGWATSTPGRPNGSELFEKLYVADGSTLSRRPQVALSITGGALTAVTTQYNLDGTGGNEAPIKPYCVEAFSSILFAFGWDSESGSFEPAIGRHSFLGIDPSDVAGFDKDAWATFGAQGQPVRAAKAGNTILLAAKENELYRITGSGRGLPGWQFAYQPLNNSQGRGCANADALEHADGKWYGSGSAGPFITDGVDVIDIRPNRRRSWASVDTLSVAWVKHHPERQAIWFGFHIAGQPSRPSHPFELWQWDMTRQAWAPTQRFPKSFHLVSAIQADGSVGPSNIPSSPAQSFEWGEFEFGNVSGTTNAGDLTSSTEVWTRGAGGGAVLAATLPAGIQRFRVPAAVSLVTFVKVRHVKGSALGEFSGEVGFYTRLLAPQVAVGTSANDGKVRADWLNYVAGVDLFVEDSSGFETSYPAVPAGFTTEYDLPNDSCYTTNPPDEGALYWAWTVRDDWPLGHEESAKVECHTLAHKCAGSITTLAPEPRQRLERGGMQEDSIAVLYFPARQNTAFRTDYRVTGAGSWTVGPVTNSGAALNLTEVALVGLQHSTIYEVRITNVASGLSSDAINMFTVLRAPTIAAIATAGTPGSPVVNLTVTPATAGRDLFLYNAIGSYQALYTAVGGVATYRSTFGVCGSADGYYARTRGLAWPSGWEFSLAAVATIGDPCTVGS